LSEMSTTFKGKKITLQQSDADKNQWKVLSDGQGVIGILATYVDDSTVAAKLEMANLLIKEIQKTWKTSEPDVIDRKTTGH
jgi:hypothetical protein